VYCLDLVQFLQPKRAGSTASRRVLKFQLHSDNPHLLGGCTSTCSMTRSERQAPYEAPASIEWLTSKERVDDGEGHNGVLRFSVSLSGLGINLVTILDIAF
jgi:hypothetical protein